MKHKIAIVILVGVLAVLFFGLFTSCQTSDAVIVTPDGWRIHSSVPIDTNGITKNKQ